VVKSFQFSVPEGFLGMGNKMKAGIVQQKNTVTIFPSIFCELQASVHFSAQHNVLHLLLCFPFLDSVEGHDLGSPRTL
jgi:hypothetical protein